MHHLPALLFLLLQVLFASRSVHAECEVEAEYFFTLLNCGQIATDVMLVYNCDTYEVWDELALPELEPTGAYLDSSPSVTQMYTELSSSMGTVDEVAEILYFDTPLYVNAYERVEVSFRYITLTIVADKKLSQAFGIVPIAAGTGESFTQIAIQMTVPLSLSKKDGFLKDLETVPEPSSLATSSDTNSFIWIEYGDSLSSLFYSSGKTGNVIVSWHSICGSGGGGNSYLFFVLALVTFFPYLVFRLYKRRTQRYSADQNNTGNATVVVPSNAVVGATIASRPQSPPSKTSRSRSRSHSRSHSSSGSRESSIGTSDSDSDGYDEGPRHHRHRKGRKDEESGDQKLGPAQPPPPAYSEAATLPYGAPIPAASDQPRTVLY